MIVKDEEQALPLCLESVQEVVDEIIVLDTGSRDRTVEVAQEYGAQIYHFPWGNNFAAARNESLKSAQGEWILVLDADERLAPEILPHLQQAIQSPSHLLINLVRQEVGASQSPYSLVSRLFRRHPRIRFCRPYHAMIDESVAEILAQEPHWQIGYLPDIAIFHAGYQATAIADSDKLNRARTAMEGFLADHPHDSYVCSKLGALYVQQGDHQRGVELLERGLGAAAIQSSICYELHYHLGIAYRHRDLARAELHYREALQQPIPSYLKLGALNNLGNLLQARGDFLAAKETYQTVIEIDSTLAVGHYNLGMTLKALGNFQGAIAAYQRAIQLNPGYAEAYQNLGVALLKVGQVPASLTAFAQAIALHEQQNPSEAARLRQGIQDLGLPL